MDEVVLDYRRVMCDLMWRSLIEKEPEMFNFIIWREINDIHEFNTPKTGNICTEMEDFTVLMKDLMISRLACILIMNYN